MTYSVENAAFSSSLSPPDKMSSCPPGNVSNQQQVLISSHTDKPSISVARTGRFQGLSEESSGNSALQYNMSLFKAKHLYIVHEKGRLLTDWMFCLFSAFLHSFSRRQMISFFLDIFHKVNISKQCVNITRSRMMLCFTSDFETPCITTFFLKRKI